MSRIIPKIRARIPKQTQLLKPSLVAVYAFFTAVRSIRLGMSMTLTDSVVFPTGIHSPVRNMGEMEKLPLGELLSWTDSLQPIERSIGMAALNSCISLAEVPLFEGNALNVASQLGKGKHVVVVGHFPHLDEIQRLARKMDILEKRPQAGDLPAEDAPRVVPQADVVAMTGVTCLNDTVEDLLALKKNGAIFIILGPTVPLSPVLFDYGVDIIGGALIDDEEKALPMLAQGATARVLKGCRNVLMPKNPSLLSGLLGVSSYQAKL